MLCELSIQNLAVIEQAHISLSDGFTVFTGETGAGKSILIDAINAVLGQRSFKEMIRHNEQRATITALFDHLNPQTLAKLEEYGFEAPDQQLVLQRDICADGKNIARINTRPTTISVMREIGQTLVSIHGQHDNQTLLAVQNHIDLLDGFLPDSTLLEEYTALYHVVVDAKRQLSRIQTQKAQKQKRIDLLLYQIDEIEQYQLKPDEDKILLSKRSLLRNAEKILQALGQVHLLLSGDSDLDQYGSVDMTKTAVDHLGEAASLYENLNPLYERLEGIGYDLEELALDVSNQLDHIVFDQTLLDKVEERLDVLDTLKAKYGGAQASVESILAYCQDAKLELESIEFSDQNDKKLEKYASQQYNRLKELANNLTALRRTAAAQFSSLMIEELRFLDMENVTLDVSIQKSKLGAKGQDLIEFLISANKGEPAKPLAKIASGGELSRLMLAFKNVLSDIDDIPTLIFDEIDTGVSGRAAQKIGLKLKQASKNRQLLCVTHSAQIAALADHHYLIRKETISERTYTRVTELDFSGRQQEVARIIGTDQITGLMLETAADMIEKGQRPR